MALGIILTVQLLIMIEYLLRSGSNESAELSLRTTRAGESVPTRTPRPAVTCWELIDSMRRFPNQSLFL